MCNATCRIHYDQTRPKLVSTHYLKIRKIKERVEKRALSQCTLRKHDFRVARLRISPRNEILPLSYAAEISRKASGNDLSQPFFHAKSDATRGRLELYFPKGILLTTHDHALLTKNYRALALEYKSKKTSLKGARSAPIPN